MADLILGTSGLQGGRPNYEDLSEVYEQVITKGNLKLSVALLADGVGGGDNGETAARFAINGAKNSIINSTEVEIPNLLIDALEDANRAVHREVRLRRQDGRLPSDKHMAATLVVAVVLHEKSGKRLFIGNVGDSRAYLLRGQTLTQLTMDHSYANVSDWPGELTQEEYQRNVTRPEALMRAIGVRETVKVDIGFYVGTDNPTVAEQRGVGGLPLQAGDSVMLCSDGLVKESQFGTPYCTDEEIILHLNRLEGERAATMLTSLANGRAADDNVTVSVIQMPDSGRRRREFIHQYRWAAAAIGVLIVAAFVALTIGNNNATRALAAQQTAAQETVVVEGTRVAGTSIAAVNTEQFNSTLAGATAAVAQAQVLSITQTAEIVLSYTPTPTSKPLVSGQAGLSSNEFIVFKGTPYMQADAGAYLEFKALSVSEGHESEQFSDPENYTRAYLFGTGALEFSDISGGSLRLELEQGGATFIVLPLGSYSQAEIKLQDTGLTVFAYPPEGGQRTTCMAMDASTTGSVTLGCYAGKCTFRLSSAAPEQTLTLGQYVTFEPVANASVPSGQSVISGKNIALIQQYRQALTNSPQPSRSDYNVCLRAYDPKTATPTPTLLVTGAVTATPLLQSTNVPATDAPPTKKQPTAISPTDVPPPTNVPPPTAVPPTDVPPPTAVPPTNVPPPTDVPPTAAPVLTDIPTGSE